MRENRRRIFKRMKRIRLKSLGILAAAAVISSSAAVNVPASVGAGRILLPEREAAKRGRSYADEQEAPETLEQLFQRAKQSEAELTGEEEESIPDSRFVVTDQESDDIRVLSAALQAEEGQESVFYVIGKNFVPNGKAIAQWFGGQAVYANLLDQAVCAGEDWYYAARFSVTVHPSRDGCSHRWRETGNHPAGCLAKGGTQYVCGRCGQEREVFLPPLGHLDEDGDAVCDRCRGDAFGGDMEKMHWNLGDLLARELDGAVYMFRCVDQNYSDGSENHRQGALFLAESVIPADYGSGYVLRETENGHEYVFEPGPVVSFGESNDYKYSAVRSFLKQMEEEMYGAEPISVGVDRAFTGSTPEGEMGSLDGTGLHGTYIGDQQVKDTLFILSVDEAVKYKHWLWKFEGSHRENPESQLSSFSKGYWLRNPMGDQRHHDTGYAYVVDLADGSIHAAAVKPAGGTGDPKLDLTVPYGIRPAFVMPQDGK